MRHTKSVMKMTRIYESHFSDAVQSVQLLLYINHLKDGDKLLDCKCNKIN